MQNIRSPYSEGYRTYTNYYKNYSTQDAWNNAVYDFLIPVYSNMGGSTTLDASGNADTTLKSLSITSCSLNPSFQSSAHEYECYIPNSITSLSIEAVATNSLAKVEYSSKVNITANEMSIPIKVTAANGTIATYTIKVYKTETDGYSPTEVLNGVGIKVSGSNIYNIEVGSDVSNIVNSISNKYHFASVTVKDASGNQISDGTVTTGTIVTVKNAGTESTFTAVIYGDPSGDGAIDIRDLLVIQKHLVKSKTISGAYYTASDINKDGTVDIRDLLLEQKYLLNAYTISQG
jgi:hypothetical protein